MEEIEDPDNPGEFIDVVRGEQVYISQKDGTGLGRSNVLISRDRQPGSFIGGATTNAIDPLENDPVQPETWYHFVMVGDNEADEILFYINGEPSELNPQFPGANGIEPADGEWVIGSHKNQGAQFFEGLLDEIAFYEYQLPVDRIKAHYEAGVIDDIPGDFDGDRMLTATDIDMLTRAINEMSMDSQFDVDQSGELDDGDRLFWIGALRGTHVGDSNLDGEFSSSDFVAVFQAGEYEDGIAENSGWATGDWNGDFEFNTSDFVIAFQHGGFEQGPIGARAHTVPEPTGCFLAIVATVFLAYRRISRK